MNTEDGEARKYWLAVANDINCRHLAQMGYPFYALEKRNASRAMRVSPGDRCALYRAKIEAGFVGGFEVAEAAIWSETKLGSSPRPFCVRIPWRPLILLGDNDVLPVAAVVDRLEFIKMKNNVGMAFRNSFREISRGDFEVLLRAMAERSAK